MDFWQIFNEVKEAFMKADVSDYQGHLALQVNMTGEGEGRFYAELNNGKLSVEPYEYYDRDATFICKADTLLKIMDGKMDPVMAFTMQKLKVEGDIGKALRLKEMIK